MPRSCGISTRTGQRNDLLIPGALIVSHPVKGAHAMTLYFAMAIVLGISALGIFLMMTQKKKR